MLSPSKPPVRAKLPVAFATENCLTIYDKMGVIAESDHEDLLSHIRTQQEPKVGIDKAQLATNTLSVPIFRLMKTTTAKVADTQSARWQHPTSLIRRTRDPNAPNSAVATCDETHVWNPDRLWNSPACTAVAAKSTPVLAPALLTRKRRSDRDLTAEFWALC